MMQQIKQLKAPHPWCPTCQSPPLQAEGLLDASNITKKNTNHASAQDETRQHVVSMNPTMKIHNGYQWVV